MTSESTLFEAGEVAAPPERFNFAQHLLEANTGRSSKTAFVDDAGTLTLIWSPKNGHHKVYYFLTLWRLYEEVNTRPAVHR